MQSVLVEEALDEFIEATQYLDAQSRGLGERFNLAFIETLELIGQFPEVGIELKRHGVRQLGVRGFSYKVIYRVEEGLLVVYALAHYKRRPNYWKTRLNP